ncbi:site-specific integrase [Aliiroseovarius sp. KMU-50]|uniref:Site-specific integrase n=1 Tax=Aliiroseovarius salicola TaxID=3009082 RepID=A0ABT4W0V6_9RHOB|nr:site-specific integrase [Aliiroseovarius sp. KMU-50]MDA5094139.1 site-specific integrase [Aliiroseovarius sp. KMU-50]
MKKETPKYVVSLKGVLYFKRRGWPTRRFQNQDLTPAFYAEYTRILNGVAPEPKAFMVKGLITSYLKSQKFIGLKPRTKTDYQKYLSRLETNAGDVAVESIERKHVIAWRDQLAQSQTPHYANYFVRVLRILMEYGIDVGEIKRNPAKGVGEVKYQKQIRKPWPKDMIQAARSARPHGDRTRLLFEMLYCTGQRVGDVLSAEWGHIRGDSIEVNQNKTGAPLVLPMTDDLKECLKLADRSGTTILTAYRKTSPWSYRGAADAMMKLRKEIGAEAHDIHAIRHTVASEIGAAGSDDEVMAVTGHTTTAMVRHYAGRARQEARAKDAQKKRE